MLESNLNLLDLVLAQMVDVVRLGSQLLASPCQRRVQDRGEAIGEARHLRGRIRQLEVLVRGEEVRVGDRAGHGVRHCGRRRVVFWLLEMGLMLNWSGKMLKIKRVRERECTSVTDLIAERR